MREDGGTRFTCGRRADAFGRSFLPEGGPPMAIVVMLLLGLTHFVAALAGRIGDKHAAYQGQWRLGVRLDRFGVRCLSIFCKAILSTGRGTRTAATSTRESFRLRPRS